MKKLLLGVLGSLFCLASYGQTFTQLGTDASGDATAGTPDLKAVHYAIDKAKDSIWFKMEYHSTITATTDYGFLFGLDTNNNINDGTAFYGKNKSMKSDVFFVIYKPSFTPNAIGFFDPYGPFITNIDISFKITNPNTVIVGAKLSNVDKDGKFNLLASSATSSVGFSSAVGDDAPETGYWTIGGGAPTGGCNAPASLTLTDVKDVSAKISWPAVTGAIEYEGAVTETATPPTSGKAVTGTSATMTGLTAKKNYYAHVRSKCNATTYSAWASQSFSTAPTGINDINGSSEISVYPNPVNDKLSIAGLTKNDHVKLLNITGTEVLSQVASTNEMELNLSSAPSGIYFLNIQSELGSKKIKIIKE